MPLRNFMPGYGHRVPDNQGFEMQILDKIYHWKTASCMESIKELEMNEILLGRTLLFWKVTCFFIWKERCYPMCSASAYTNLWSRNTDANKTITIQKWQTTQQNIKRCLLDITRRDENRITWIEVWRKFLTST